MEMIIRSQDNLEEIRALILLLETSLFRELAYNLEHAIHHEALIKVAIKELSVEGVIFAHFGISLSTVRYNNNKINNHPAITRADQNPGYPG